MMDKLIVIIALFFCIFILVFTDYGKNGRVYDCRISEISPDFPIEVKEECRRLRKEFHDNQNRSEYIT
jgi:hypothetical protein